MVNFEAQDQSTGSSNEPSDDGKELESKIEEALDKIRPYLNMDGGDIEFVSFDKDSGVVTVRLQGACGHCAISSVTMKMGVEQTLMEEVPEVKSVVEAE